MQHFFVCEIFLGSCCSDGQAEKKMIHFLLMPPEKEFSFKCAFTCLIPCTYSIHRILIRQPRKASWSSFVTPKIFF